MSGYYHGHFWSGTLPPVDATPEEVAAIIASDPAWSFKVNPNNAVRRALRAAWWDAGRADGAYWLRVTQEIIRIADNPNVPAVTLAEDLAYLVAQNDL